MNQINSTKQINNSFFFFVDSLENNDYKYLKIDAFFKDPSKLYPNVFFSAFCNSKIDFDFLEKNDKLISFFFYGGKFFFKNQVNNLKKCFLYENKLINTEKKLNLSFFLNFFFFFRHVYCFLFLLKKLSFKRSR